MTLWIGLVVAAQLINALIVLIDKFLLTSKGGVQSPVAYAFYTAILPGSVLVLVPFGVIGIPSLTVFFFATLSAALYVVALIGLYTALKDISATAAAPIIGVTTTVASAVLAFFFLAEDLQDAFLPAVVLMAVGMFLVYCFCFSWKSFATVVVAGLLLGSSTFLLKIVFGLTDVWNALFWPLFMDAVVAVFVLLPLFYKHIRRNFKDTPNNMLGLAFGNKILGGVVFALIYMGIALGSVSVVNALSGLQLVFILMLAPLFAARFPGEFSGELLPGKVLLQVTGTILIVGGLAVLFVF